MDSSGGGGERNSEGFPVVKTHSIVCPRIGLSLYLLLKAQDQEEIVRLREEMRDHLAGVVAKRELLDQGRITSVQYITFLISG